MAEMSEIVKEVVRLEKKSYFFCRWENGLNRPFLLLPEPDQPPDRDEEVMA
jgi:hypothetical protein